VPAHTVDEDLFEEGKMFDGSSISGWKGINESDMILMPDPESAVVDVFSDETTVNLRCHVIEPATMQGYDRCPRSLASRAEAYLKSTGIADAAYFGPENEFFVFDHVSWDDSMQGAFYKIDSDEGAWNTDRSLEEGNTGHRPTVKGGYFPVPPVDSLHDIRSAMCLALEDMGVTTEVHHHEVATAGQCEIGAKFNTLVRKADEVQILKYVVHNVAHAYGKTATFMRTCSRVTAMVACRRRHFITSAASSSMPRHSTRSPTRRRTATSVSYPASKHQRSSLTRLVTARRRFAFRTSRIRRGAVSRFASVTRWPIRTCVSLR
jgi:glutamine synthetase